MISALAFFRELQTGFCRSARRDEIIDEQDFISGFERISVHVKLVCAVFEIIGLAKRRPGQLCRVSLRAVKPAPSSTARAPPRINPRASMPAT